MFARTARNALSFARSGVFANGHAVARCRSLSHTSSSARSTGLEQYRAFLLDMDGVLHQFGRPVPGAKDFLEMLVEEPIPFIVITNECRYTSVDLQTKLVDVLGVKVPESQIYTAANSVRDFFLYNIRQGWTGNVFALGEDGIIENIKEAMKRIPGGKVVTSDMLASGEAEDIHCDFVCIGTVATGGPNDSWTNAEHASKYLRKGAKLLYSNPDWYEVTNRGDYKFGCPMPVVNLLMQVTGCKAYNLGKPNPFMLRGAHRQLVDAILRPLSKSQRSFVQGSINSKEVLFVGDSIDTDLRTAIENGIDSALVLSGTTSVDALSKSALRPNFVFENIRALHTAFLNGEMTKGSRNYALQDGILTSSVSDADPTDMEDLCKSSE